MQYQHLSCTLNATVDYELMFVLLGVCNDIFICDQLTDVLSL